MGATHWSGNPANDLITYRQRTDRLRHLCNHRAETAPETFGGMAGNGWVR